jgi:hypothetical protein
VDGALAPQEKLKARIHLTLSLPLKGKMSEGQKRSSAYHPGALTGRFVGQFLSLHDYFIFFDSSM